MKRIKNLKALGNATINGEYYYFLGKNVEIASETLEHYGVKNFFKMTAENKSTITFIKANAAGPIPAKKIYNPDKPTYIINKVGEKWNVEYDIEYKYK